MSLNLFDMEGLSLQPESYLDETFGLSADILAADLDTDGSILDMGLGPMAMEGNKLPSLQQPSGSLDDLFTDGGGSFGEEWMETVDLSSLLDNNLLPQVPAQVINVKLDNPEPLVVTAPLIKQEPEPRKEGMKAAAFELLKALLTGNSADANLSTESSPVPPSPEAEVPDMSILSDSFIDPVDSQYISMENSIDDLLELQSETMVLNGNIVEIKPEISLIDLAEPSLVELASPLDRTDLESILSSGPSSPESSISLYTIDTSQLSDSSIQSSVDKSSQITDNDFVATKQVKKQPRGKEKTRLSPYGAEPVYDKKGRKKEQNKNAATRYRVKKRDEKDTLQQQEVQLTDKNKGLKEKVESLQREIKYMKELMNEIYKAKKSNI